METKQKLQLCSFLLQPQNKTNTNALTIKSDSDLKLVILINENSYLKSFFKFLLNPIQVNYEL